jgi:hypothetical protein
MLAESLINQEQQGKEYEKELELAKFHEERGKVKCACYDCEAKREIRGKIKTKIDKNWDEKEQCPECKR